MEVVRVNAASESAISGGCASHGRAAKREGLSSVATIYDFVSTPGEILLEEFLELLKKVHAIEVHHRGLQHTAHADPMDTKASSALRELYAKQGKDQELADLLDRLIDVAQVQRYGH